ncbi:MAG: hypothetical protein ABRQ37_24600, partial [Candidatus Eremiobacterota bacterium]
MKSLTGLLITISLMSMFFCSISARELPGTFQKAYISGKITCEGSILTDVRVNAIGQGGFVFATDATNGNYALGVGEGTWSVTAEKDGYYMEKAITVKTGAEEIKENINIEMKKTGCYIKGQVVDEENKPVAEAGVTASMEQTLNYENMQNMTPEDIMAQMLGSRRSFSVKADGKGYFTLCTTAGAFTITASAVKHEMSPKNESGVKVEVKEGETKTGVIIIMKLSDKSSMYFDSDGNMEKMEKIKPVQNILAGKEMVTPNNVLHWTRKENNEELIRMYVIARSTKDFSASKKEDIKIFNYENSYGMP